MDEHVERAGAHGGGRVMADPTRLPHDVAPMTDREARSRRARNVAIGLAIFAFMALIYAVTIARLSGAVTGSAG